MSSTKSNRARGRGLSIGRASRAVKDSFVSGGGDVIVADGASRPLSGLLPRMNPDTRSLNPVHVVSLAESISALGVIEPLVVDADDHLLAGAHRLAACRLLAVEPEARGALLTELCPDQARQVNAALIEQARRLPLGELELAAIPVRAISFHSKEDPQRALQIEAAENEKRRDYTPREVRSLYDRLIDAGYTDRRGKPAAGEKAARPALAAIIGKSLRTVRRMLAEVNNEANATESPSKLTQLIVSVSNLERALDKLQRAACEVEELPEEVEELMKALSGRRLQTKIAKVKALDAS